MRLDSDNILHVTALDEYFDQENDQYQEITYACYVTVTGDTTKLVTSYSFNVVLSRNAVPTSVVVEEIVSDDAFNEELERLEAERAAQEAADLAEKARIEAEAEEDTAT